MGRESEDCVKWPHLDTLPVLCDHMQYLPPRTTFHNNKLKSTSSQSHPGVHAVDRPSSLSSPSATAPSVHLQSCPACWLVIHKAHCKSIITLTPSYFVIIHPWEGISESNGVSTSNVPRHSPKGPSRSRMSDGTPPSECGVPGPCALPAPAPASSRGGQGCHLT